MFWYCGLTALFLFIFARAAPAYLPTALSVALRPLFPFPQAQYAQVYPLKPSPFCTLFAGLGSTNKSAISLLLSKSRFVLATLSSPPSFLLSQRAGYTGGATGALVVSLLLSLVSTLLFSRTGGVLSHLNSLTRRLPQFPLRNLCSLVMLTVFSLVYSATDTAFC